jgi:uncharacterized membrane protein
MRHHGVGLFFSMDLHTPLEREGSIMTGWILFGLFVFFSLLAGGTHGLKTIFTLLLNMGCILAIVALIIHGWNPVITALIGCLVITCLILFFNCGINAKTMASFLSVFTVLVLQLFFVLWITDAANLGGFGFEDLNDVAGYSFDIGIKISAVATACIMMGLIGALTDTAIAVSTAVFEVKANYPDSAFSDLYASGLRVGKDITGTTVNTLYFALLGEAATLMIWYHIYDYSWWELFNSIVFCREFIKLCFFSLSCVLVMPVCAAFCGSLLSGSLHAWMTKIEKGMQKLKKWIQDE